MVADVKAEFGTWWNETTHGFCHVDVELINDSPLKDRIPISLLNGEAGWVVEELANRWGTVALQASVLSQRCIGLESFICQQTGLADKVVRGLLTRH